MRSRRGFLLVVVLFLMLIVLLLGLAFLGSRAARSRAAVRRIESQQARALAEAGMEDARVKLWKDLFFPPPGGDDQTVYSYMEEMTDAAGGVVGSYVVTVDLTYATEPYFVVQVRSSGVLGPAQEPRAVRTLQAEFDMSEADRVTGSAPNPDNHEIIHWSEDP